MELYDPFAGYCELRVRFDCRTWKVWRDGLIYTDEAFLRELKQALKKRGFPVRGLDYTEQGMQGDDYISLSAGPSFVQAYKKKGGKVKNTPQVYR